VARPMRRYPRWQYCNATCNRLARIDWKRHIDGSDRNGHINQKRHINRKRHIDQKCINLE